MERYKTKNGFTLIEVLVSGTILVIAMALIAIFFVKTSKIRSAVSKENNTQVTASQMMNGALFGVSQLSDGLTYATRIQRIDTSNGDSPLWVIFLNSTSTNYVRLRIGLDTGGATDTTLYQETNTTLPPIGTPWTTLINLDPNDKVDLASGTWFACYGSNDNITIDTAVISRIELYLTVRDKKLPDAPPFILRNTVTLRNIPHID